MFIHPNETVFNGIHWSKWDQRIKDMGKLYVDCILLKGLEELDINPAHPSEEQSQKLYAFCDKETEILY